jgi:hypothetical protein
MHVFNKNAYFGGYLIIFDFKLFIYLSKLLTNKNEYKKY